MIYFEIKDKTGKVLAGNMQEFSRVTEFEQKKIFSDHKRGKGVKGVCEIVDDVEIWIVVEDESDLLNSSKLFKKTVDAYMAVALGVYKSHKEKIDAYSHVLNTIQAQIRQKIQEFADDSEFYGDTYADSVAHIEMLVKNNNKSAADLLCYIQKRIIDMRAHLLGAEIIHSGKEYELRITTVRLKRAILNQCTPFLEELNDKLVEIKFYFGEECETSIDKNLFSLMMYNFFSNAVKYTRSNSEIRLNYSSTEKSLDISMISLKMEKAEIKSLFNEGVRGSHARHVPGKGIGLFVTQQALNLMGKKPMYISPNYQNNYCEDGSLYIENHFKFEL
mgnify:CR=1 FL=1